MTDKDWRKFCELMTTAAEYYRVQPWTERAMKRAEERIAIIAEGREAREEDFSAAWECVLRLKFPPPREREGES